MDGQCGPRSPNRLALGQCGWRAIGVFAGGLLYDRAGYGAAITAVVAVGLLAIPTAYLVRWPASVEEPNHPPTSVEEDNAQVSWRQLAAAAFRSPVHRWLTLGSFFVYLLSGVVVSTRRYSWLPVSTPVPAHSSSAGQPRSSVARGSPTASTKPSAGYPTGVSQHAGDARRARAGGSVRCSLLAAACSGDPCAFAALHRGALHTVVAPR